MERVTDSPQDPGPKGHFQFCVIVPGDVAVGKSLLLRCFADRSGGGPGGAATPGPTTGVELYSRIILIPTGKAELQLWDTTGQERFSIPEWYREAAGDQPTAFVLVGHKCDLVAERAVSAEEAGHLATNLGMAFVETSAHSNFNMKLAFLTLAGGIQQALGQGILARHQGCDGIRLIPNQSRCQPPAGREPQECCQC